MKAVYIETITIEITLTNGNTIVENDYTPTGFIEYRYKYGEVPTNIAVEYKEKSRIIYNLAYEMLIPVYQTLFKKRRYIWINSLGNSDFGRRIYEDKIQSFIVKRNYKIITNPSVKKLQSDLDFYTYSQLIFDREQTLKGMLNKSD